MNKKSFLIIGLAIVILVIAIIILASGIDKNEQSMVKSGSVVSESGQSLDVPDTVKIIQTEADGTQVETEINTVTPGRAIDSSEIMPESLAVIPLNEEAIIKYGVNGLETKEINALAGARVFLTFSASDDERHIFSFSDPSMSAVLVMFSKAEGDKSINFLAPGPGSYEYSIDGEDKGMLIVK